MLDETMSHAEVTSPGHLHAGRAQPVGEVLALVT